MLLQFFEQLTVSSPFLSATARESMLREKRYKEAAAESEAGYDNLIKQTSPATSYIRAARKDLVADCEALRQPEKAARFKAELEAADKTPAK